MRLNTLKKALNEIVDILANNQNIAKLVYIDNENALLTKEGIPSAQELINQGYITVFPKDVSGIKNAANNTLISIVPDTFMFRDKDTELTGNIYISSPVNLLHLSNNKFRLIEIIDNIMDCLHKKKLSSSILLTISSAVFDISDTFRVGYSIHFTLIDQVNSKVVI